MKILFDTNILLDVFLKRETFFAASVKLTGLAERNAIEGWLCSTSVTVTHYLLNRALNRKMANEHLATVLQIFHISLVDRAVLEEALASDFSDYEDAVLNFSALHSSVDGILTRNSRDFKNSSLPVYTPEELLAGL